jgi:glycosyltransferase involved in cell wall biosynthesis
MYIESEVNNKPKVSIGVPIFNGDKYLSEMLDSLISQTFVDFEIIISDNNSTDNTFEIVTKYAQKDNRIKYFKQEYNIGAAKNWKFVLSESNGEFFFWASCDDIWAPNFIESLLSGFQNDNILSVFCFYDIIDYYDNTKVESVYPVSCTTNNKFNNFLICLLNEDVIKIFGIFRTQNLKTIVNKLKSDDYFEIAVLRWNALMGGLVIIPHSLFTYRLQRNKIRKYNNSKNGYKVIPFLKDSINIVHKSNFSFMKKIILYLYSFYYSIKILQND